MPLIRGVIIPREEPGYVEGNAKFETLLARTVPEGGTRRFKVMSYGDDGTKMVLSGEGHRKDGRFIIDKLDPS